MNPAKPVKDEPSALHVDELVTHRFSFAIAAALLRFGFLERRAHADD